MNICRENTNLVKIEQKYRALYPNTQARSILAGDIKSPLQRSVRVKLHQAVKVPYTKAAQPHLIPYTKAPQPHLIPYTHRLSCSVYVPILTIVIRNTHESIQKSYTTSIERSAMAVKQPERECH
jgi:hypothetical protein